MFYRRSIDSVKKTHPSLPIILHIRLLISHVHNQQNDLVHQHMQVIDSVKKTHPSLPIILYISGSGGLLERMAAANPDIISIDQSVDIVDGIKRVGSGFAIQVCVCFVLFCGCTVFTLLGVAAVVLN
jgi:hypothetical protein